MSNQIDIYLYKELLKKRLKELSPEDDPRDDIRTILFSVYVEHMDHIPYTMHFSELLEIFKDGKLCKKEDNLSVFAKSLFNELKRKFGREVLEFEDLDLKKSMANVIKAFPDSEVIKIDAETTIIINPDFILHRGAIFQYDDTLNTKLRDCFVLREVEEKPIVKLVVKTAYGFTTTPINVLVKEKEGNYNDDLPYEKITQLIRSDESALILLHGIPGTGKSSILRSLINDNKDRTFLYLDSSIFRYIEDSSFIEFLINNKNAIFILEDCELLLESRDEKPNGLISTLLNLSDGILGDGFNIKFICTFNAEDTKIDEALLRKGRLKCKYEFKKLTKDKVAKIFEKQGIDTSKAKEMTLAEVYNFLDETGIEEKKEQVRIGFQ